MRTGETLAEVGVADAAPGLDPGVSGRPVFTENGRYLDVPTNLGVARFGATDLRPVGFAAADQNIQGVRDVARHVARHRRRRRRADLAVGHEHRRARRAGTIPRFVEPDQRRR